MPDALPGGTSFERPVGMRLPRRRLLRVGRCPDAHRLATRRLHRPGAVRRPAGARPPPAHHPNDHRTADDHAGREPGDRLDGRVRHPRGRHRGRLRRNVPPDALGVQTLARLHLPERRMRHLRLADLLARAPQRVTTLAGRDARRCVRAYALPPPLACEP